MSNFMSDLMSSVCLLCITAAFCFTDDPLHHSVQLTRERGRVDEEDLEFFTDGLLKELGVTDAITRVRMLRRISEHFKQA
jgi:hypothetical protein